MLRLYNSLTGKKDKFVPLESNKVKMYVCGITPYDTTHLGHAFTYVFFSTLVRYLKFRGYEVNYTQNVTDIDDDILKRAKEEKKDWKELGDFWTDKFLKDMKKLNVSLPTHYVKATGSITLMIRIIRVLIEKRLAYERNGNVYFEVGKIKSYGRLSKFNRNQMILISKERGGNPDDLLKKDPLDFLLWQRSPPKADQPLPENEPFWQSPWGKGRPAWHIECSAMINRFLGDQIDIHGGGRDLVFPHHESEIAQSESFTNKKPFVKYWMHTSMVLYQGEKMSKSLGNLIMVDSLLEDYTANEIRWLLLSHHYRKPWEFDYEDIVEVQKKVRSIMFKLRHSGNPSADGASRISYDDGDSGQARMTSYEFRQFESLMDDDFNTPQVLNFILELSEKPRAAPALLKCLSILGIEF